MWGQFTRSRRLVTFERESLTTPDGDELLVDHLPGAAASPRLIVLHGLEGSSFSVYVQGILVLARARGLRATVLNFRSCARDPADTVTFIPNRRPRLYHSGETGDFDFVSAELARREPGVPLVALGISLGGNVLLKWLGEHPGQTRIAAAATISVPYDLGAGADHLVSRIGRVYLRHFLPSMLVKLTRIVERFPEARHLVDLEAARRARDFRPFDDVVTGPLHGFSGAEDYYTRSSSIGFVDRITTPTLCVSAENDPFQPREVLERLRARVSPSVELEITPSGGHVGFVAGPGPRRPRYWAEERTVDWLVRAVS